MLRKHWYIACASIQLTDVPKGVKVLDREIVVFRDDRGQPHALLDRCCHRGYKLSCGSVIDNTVHCGYHGWRFDGDGQCVNIPSLRTGASIPKAFCVASFQCVERDGYIWVWMGPRDVEPHYMPSIPEFAAGDWIQGSIAVDCEATKAIEISLDFHHVYYVHPSLPQSVEWRKNGEVLLDTTGEVRLTDDGFVYFWPPTESALDPVPEHVPKVRFQLPNVVKLEWPVGPGQKQYHYFFIVPTGPRSCRMEHLLPQYRPSGTKVRWADTLSEVIVEDKRVLEVVQQAADTPDIDDSVERSVEVDIPTLMARKMLRMLEKESFCAVREKLGARKVFAYRAGPR